MPDPMSPTHLIGAKSQWTDEALMTGYVEGDCACFEELFGRYRSPLFTYLLHSTGNRQLAEDLFQEVFLKIIRTRERYRATGNFRTWLYTIAHNACVDEGRSARVRSSTHTENSMIHDDHNGAGSAPLEGAAQEPSSDPAAVTQAKELGERIEAALLEIPAEQRQVFLLRERAGLDHRAIAEATGSGLATVKSRMRYALANLRRILAKDPSSLSECLHE